jgi:hypothetical protein
VATVARAAVETLRVARALPVVELGRRLRGPGPLVEELRRRAKRAPRRTPEGRALLQRVIAGIDRRLPGDPSCYRRVLIETMLDAGAAEERIYFGLRVPGGPRSGHAWLGGDPAQAYDVQFEM